MPVTGNGSPQELKRGKQERGVLPTTVVVTYGSEETTSLQIPLVQNEPECIHSIGGDGKQVKNDMEGFSSRRPAIIDRLHLIFFVLSVPVTITIVVLFFVLYMRDDVNAHTAVLSISCISALTSVGMTGLLILCHLTVYVCPTQQRLICRIILLVPVYALDSLIALVFFRIATVVALVRDTYEAYVIYQFYFLLMHYLGGEGRVLELWRRYGTGKDYVEPDGTMDGANTSASVVQHALPQNEHPGMVSASPKSTYTRFEDHQQKKQQQQQQQEQPVCKNGKVCEVSKDDEVRLDTDLYDERQRQYMSHTFPMNLCFSPILLNNNTLFLWKLLLTQYMILNPLLTLLTIPLYFTNLYHDGSFSAKDAYPYLAMIRTISVSFALTALVYFYFATKAYMQRYSPTLKFLAIKAVVFLSFWQGVLLSALVFYGVIPDNRITSAKEVAAAMQNFLICVEMYFISIAHRWVFNDDIYLRSNNGQRLPLRMWMIRHVLSVGDVIDEAGSVVRMAPKTAERLIRRQFDIRRRRVNQQRDEKHRRNQSEERDAAHCTRPTPLRAEETAAATQEEKR